jgi:cellulose synthase operon protein C
MTDDPNKNRGEGEFEFDEDWSSALDDWESNAFSEKNFSNPPPAVAAKATDADLPEDLLSQTLVQPPSPDKLRASSAPTEDVQAVRSGDEKAQRSLDPESREIAALLGNSFEEVEAPSSMAVVDAFEIPPGSARVLVPSPTQSKDSVTRVLIGSVPPAVARASVLPLPLDAGLVKNLAIQEHELAFDNERSAQNWLSAEERQDLWDTARWIGQEADSAASAADASRLFLAASELTALSGDLRTAHKLAEEAQRSLPDDEASALVVRQFQIENSGNGDAALERESTLASTDARKRTLSWLSSAYARYRGARVSTLYNGVLESTPLDLERFASAWRDGLNVERIVSDASVLASSVNALAEEVFGVRQIAAAETSVLRPFHTARELFQAQKIPETIEALGFLGEQEPGLREACRWMTASLSLHHDATRISTAEHLSKIGTPLANRALASFAVESQSAAIVSIALEAPSSLDEEGRVWLSTLFPLEVSDTGTLSPLPPGTSISAPGRIAFANLRGHTQTTGYAMRDLAQCLVLSGESLSELEARVLKCKEQDLSAAELDLFLCIKTGRPQEIAAALESSFELDESFLVAAGLVAEKSGDQTRAMKLYGSAKKNAWANLSALEDDASEPSTASRALVHLLRSIDRRQHAGMTLGAARTLQAMAPEWGLAPRLAEFAVDPAQAQEWRQLVLQTTAPGVERAITLARYALFPLADGESSAALFDRAAKEAPNDLALQDAREASGAQLQRLSQDWRASHDAPAVTLERALILWCQGDPAHALNVLRDVPLSRAPKTVIGALLEGLCILVGDAHTAERFLKELGDTDDVERRIEFYESLAVLDGNRSDHSSVLLWHRTILEELPSHLPSLRYLEHTLITEGRDDELEPFLSAIARTLAGRDAAEVTAHACVATRLRVRHDDAYWPQTKQYAELAANEKSPSLWSLRALNSHARFARSEALMAQTLEELLLRTSSAHAADRSALLLRLADVRAKQGKREDAVRLLQEAAILDSRNASTWETLSTALSAIGLHKEAATAQESLATASSVPEHQLSAWYEAATLWRKSGDTQSETRALESAVEIDAGYEDVFRRLSQLYIAADRKGDLAHLLEGRLVKAETSSDRVSLKVELGSAQFEMGDMPAAIRTLRGALEIEPGHPLALNLLASAFFTQKDYPGAESAWVQLTRFSSTPEDQRQVFERLGDLYATHLQNPPRAEIAYQEVLKRAPGDEKTLRKLVQVYRAGQNPARALETYEVYLKLAPDPKEREKRLIELAILNETIAGNPRKAEGILETTRREFPTSVVTLRALAEFFARQRQGPAMNVLLDRAAADARRAITAGRFTAALFQTLSVVAELRGRAGGAAVIDAALAAFEGRTLPLEGLGARAVDPRLDEFSAPELISPPFRALLGRNGDALDGAAPLDIKRLAAIPAPAQYGRVTQVMGQLAQQMGMGGLQILMAPKLGRVCLPAASATPTVVVGQALLDSMEEGPRLFLTFRALKLVYMRASSLVRLPPGELAVLLGAWFKAFNPSWVAPGLNAAQVAEAARRLAPGLPKKMDPQLGTLALESASALGNLSGGIGGAVVYWSNRTALIATGDVTSALTGLAWSLGQEVPMALEARAAWISRTPDARDLLTYACSDAYLEARKRSGLTA